ncbi:hypothetical protein MYXO_02848 [Myxococcaceae bacterium]|jgi:hypothetical protein|nr:hypothetical protein MYXO_02848 [Myxococcaceae bacterium]
MAAKKAKRPRAKRPASKPAAGTKRAAAKPAAGRGAKASARASRKKATSGFEAAAEAERFAADLFARGEVAEKAGRSLPAGVTHEVVGRDGSGRPKLRRRRFSTV